MAYPPKRNEHTHKLSHWTDPRRAIATKYQNNDLGYATHGAIQAMVVLKKLAMNPVDLASMTVVDYGCGTGRIGRVLSPLFKRVYCYDPVPACIAEGKAELVRIDMNTSNVTLTSSLDDIPECDVGFSVNVIEHLTLTDQHVMVNNLKTKIKGTTVLWYSVLKNREAVNAYLTPEEIQADIPFNIQVKAIHFRKP